MWHNSARIDSPEVIKEFRRHFIKFNETCQQAITGIRGDATTIIARSDLLVFSSDWEGLSIAALEALARGVPVVSTAVEGTRELLSEGAGVVVPHEEEALAAAIVECLGDPARRSELGATGRRLHRERFSSARMAAAYRTLYERLLAD